MVTVAPAKGEKQVGASQTRTNEHDSLSCEALPEESERTPVRQELDKIVVQKDLALCADGSAVFRDNFACAAGPGLLKTHEEASGSGSLRRRFRLFTSNDKGASIKDLDKSPGIWNDASLLLCFTAVALLAAAPRALMLLIMSAVVPHAPLPQALGDFNSMWALCKDPDRLFPAFSPDGQLYKWLAITDDVFIFIGYTIAILCCCHVIFCPEERAMSTRMRRAQQCAFYLFCALAVGSLVDALARYAVLLYPINSRNEVQAVSKLLWLVPDTDSTDGSTVRLTTISYLFLSGVVDRSVLLVLVAVVFYTVLPPGNDHLREAACGDWYRVKFAGISILQWVVFIAVYEVPTYAIVCVKVSSAITRLFLMRNLSFVDDTNTLDLANMMQMFFESTVSMEFRSRLNGLFSTSAYTESELWNTALESLVMCGIEALVFGWTCLTNVLRSRTHLEKLNTKSLEDLSQAYRKHQQQMKVFYAHFLTGELTEITVCALLGVYEIAAPVWTQEATWYALADYHGPTRSWNAVAKLVIRLGMQVGDASCLHWMFSSTNDTPS